VTLYTAESGDAITYQNNITIGSLELNGTPLEAVVGFTLNGPGVLCNRFVVTRTLIPPTSVGSYIATIENSAAENMFELAHFDMSKIAIASDAGYNIFRQECVGFTYYPGLVANVNARSTICSTAAPVSGVWRQGDKCWNSAPAAAGYAGWLCVTSGEPGTWKGFGVIES
jgi:hypothetical protein